MSSTYVVTSHGGDFFGVDTYTLAALRELGQHIRCVLPAADHPPLTQLLEHAGNGEQAIDADRAGCLAALLRAAASRRGLQRHHSAIAARLALAAQRAATEGAPWTWTTTEAAVQ
jgi:hypothetical protein